MRIFARIISLPFAVCLVALGSFGLLGHYGTETELADRTRRMLQALNRWVIDQGYDVSRDLAVSTEDWVAGTFLRFVLLPVGLIALAFAVGLIGGSGGVLKTEARPETDEEGPVKADKRVSKRVQKQAHSLKKQGKVVEAAELLWDHELLDEAAEMFIGIGEFVRAAEIRHDQNRFFESAELHFQGENFEAAGSIFGQQEAWFRAAECYLKADLKSVAAEMFEKAGNHRQAAECFRATEFMRHAAANFVQCQQWRAAAECLEQVFAEEGGRSSMDPKKSADMAKLVRQAGKLFLKSEDPAKALEIFQRGGCSLEAGEVALLLGDAEAAALHFRTAGKVERAAECLRESGQEKARGFARPAGTH